MQKKLKCLASHLTGTHVQVQLWFTPLDQAYTRYLHVLLWKYAEKCEINCSLQKEAIKDSFDY